MPEIIVFDNPELFKVLSQAREYMPVAGLHNVNSVENLTAGNIIIVAAERFKDIKEQLINTVNIVILSSGEVAEPGAEVVIHRPYMLKELINVLHGLVIKVLTHNQSIIIGEFEFDPSSRLLVKNNENIELTEKESELILLLYRSGSEVIPREKILKEVWGYEDNVDTHTLETHIYRIRQKIGKNDDLIGSSQAGYFLKLS